MNAKQVTSKALTENSNILLDAASIIYGDREETYGNPTKNLNHIAEQWTLLIRQKYGLVDFRLSAEDVCWMMVDLKKARQMNSAKRDNLIDGAGYIALIERIHSGK